MTTDYTNVHPTATEAPKPEASGNGIREGTVPSSSTTSNPVSQTTPADSQAQAQIINETLTSTAPAPAVNVNTWPAQPPPPPQPNTLPNRNPTQFAPPTGPYTTGPTNIPPPPKANEMPRSAAPPLAGGDPTQSTPSYTQQPHLQAQTGPGPGTGTQTQPYPLQHNLEHPPGYVQNPVIQQHQAGADQTMKPEYNLDLLGGKGKWVWDAAPGEAGGRYVYDYGFDGDENMDYGGNDGGEGLWPDTGIWESTMSWMRTAGSKLVEVEEGVWRWVNNRT